MSLPARRFHGRYGMVEGRKLQTKTSYNYLCPARPRLAIDAISVAVTAQQCGRREHFERSQLLVARNAGTNQTCRDGGFRRLPGMGSTGGNARARPLFRIKLEDYRKRLLTAYLARAARFMAFSRRNLAFRTR